MGHWDTRAAAADNIRMYEAQDTWRRNADDVDPATETIRTPGCANALARFLTNGLSATNVLLLTGAGSSFCIKNLASTKLKEKTAPSLDDLTTAVKAKVGNTKYDAVIAKIPNGQTISNIEKLLTQCKLYIALNGSDEGKSDSIADFIKDAELAILERVDFIDSGTELHAHDMLLRKLARRGIRKPRAKVFTTNYDLCFEYSARRLRFVVIDGFSHASPQVYDRSHFSMDFVRRDGFKEAPDYLDSVFQLYKLHGSIDWRRTAGDIVRARGTEGAPVLIYPRDSKYQEAFEPPYLDMMAAFQSALREPDTTLIVAGFSFSDSHIASPIVASLESNMSFRLVVCDPAFLKDGHLKDDPALISGAPAPTNEFHKKLMRLAQTGDQRVLLLHGRFEDLAMAMPDLVAETERERHAERVKALREATPPAGSGAKP